MPYQWALQNAAASNLILTVLEPIEGAGHGLSGEYAALINEQADYFLWWAMDLGERSADARVAAPAVAVSLRAGCAVSRRFDQVIAFFARYVP